MIKNTKNWLLLSDDAYAMTRQSVPISERSECVKTLLSEIKQTITHCREILFFEGKYSTDDFCAKAKSFLYTSEESKLVPRVRWDIELMTPSFYWSKIKTSYFPVQDGRHISSHTKNGVREFYRYKDVIHRNGWRERKRYRVVLTNEHIPYNKKSWMIASKVFTQEPLWSRSLGRVADRRLSYLRRQGIWLSEMTRLLKQISYAANEYYKFISSFEGELRSLEPIENDPSDKTLFQESQKRWL